MFPDEMMIEVRMQQQNLSSNKNRKFQDEEILWYLNKAVDVIVRDKVSPLVDSPKPFAADTVDFSDIETLVVDGEVWPVLQNTARPFSLLRQNSRCQYMLSMQASGTKLCTGDSVQTLPIPIYLAYIRVPEDSNGLYTNFELVVNGQTMFTTRNTPYSNLNSPKLRFFLINQCIEALEYYGYNAYWQQDPTSDTLSPSTLVIESLAPLADAYVKIGVITTPATFKTVQKAKTNYVVTKYVPLVVMTPSFRANVLNDPFYRPNENFGIAVWNSKSSHIYMGVSDIYNDVIVSYIRKPRKIDLILNHACDLPESVHQKVCDKAVELIMKDIQHPAYQAQVIQNAKSI